MITSTRGFGHSVGPITGGALGEWLGWRGLFGIPITLALVLTPLALRSLPNGRAARACRFDAAGGLLLAISAGLFLFVISQAQAVGFRAFALLVAFLAATVLVWRSKRVAHPFVSLGLLRNRNYVAALSVAPVTMFASRSVLMLVPLLVAEVNGLSSSATGLVLRHPILIGLGILTLTVAALSNLAGFSPAVVAVFMACLGTGVACVQSPTNNAAANSLPEEDVGAGMEFHQGTGFLMGAAGLAIMGAPLAARQETHQAAWNPPCRLEAAPFSDVFPPCFSCSLWGPWQLPSDCRRPRVCSGLREPNRLVDAPFSDCGRASHGAAVGGQIGR